MKKRYGAFFTALTVLALLFAVCLSASAADTDLNDTGKAAELSKTGVTYADLGQSFYARISLTEPKLYMTIPSDELHTTLLRKYANLGTQIWHFARQSDGSYKIRNVYENLYLELYDRHTHENDETIHSTANSFTEQRWILQRAGSAYQIITCCNTSYMLKGVNLYGENAEIVISQDSYRDTTRFEITKLPFTSDYLEAPSVKLSNTVSGVSINWNSVPYAESYRVYRYNDSTKKWVAVKNTTGTSFTDNTVVSGKTYRYTVKCITPLYSKFRAQSITYIAPPNPSVSNTATGPKISWPKVNGAQAYRVFYKTTGSWKTLATTTKTAYVHKNAAYNVDYSYTVRCISADGKKYTSAFNTTGVQNRIVQSPKLTVKLNPNGFQLNWNNVTGAYRYKVFIKSKATNWTWSKSVVCIYNNFFYSEPLDNEGYYFAVRCMDEKNNLISGFISSAKLMYYSAPRVNRFVSTSSTTYLTWNKVTGAAKYRIFSWNGQKWVKRADTAATSITLKNIGTEEQNACFAVRCMDKNGKFISNFYETILSGSTILSYHQGGYTSTHKF